MIPECLHAGCTRFASVVTTVIFAGAPARRWALLHCDEHAGDGPAVATALGLVIV